MNSEDRFFRNLIAWAIVCIVLTIGGAMYGLPKYRVYRLETGGRAKLAEAAWTRKIQVEDAKGKLEAMKYEQERITAQAQADAKRKEIIARGDSLSNSITAGSLEGDRGLRYMQYLWINRTIDASTQLIYLPAFGTLPFTEAGRAVQK